MPTKPTPPLPSRAEWLGTRAALAGQRSARFAVVATGICVLALAVVILAPGQAPAHPGSRALPDEGPDTSVLSRQVDEARQRLARADSEVEVATIVMNSAGVSSADLTSIQRQSRDSLRMLATSLDELLDRATRAPLPASFRALAAAAALRGDPRTKTLDDSLDALDRRRAALGPTTGAERAAAEITDQVNEVGARIREVATRRRGRLSRDLAQLEAAAGAAPSADTLVPRAARDAARRGVQHAESLFAMARGRGSDVRQRDALSAPHVDQRLPPLAVLVAALVLALCGRFGWSLASEVRRPTIGSAREAERAAGAPVLAIARAAAASRTRGGIDPFRMLYLALTATGTKMRTVTIGGHERGVIATVAARLASAAAGDARATMVVDADAEGSSLGGYYHLGPEPGFTDAVAGVHLWRDVTHSVGASEGLTIDVVTGGAIRRDEPDRETLNSARSEFARVRSEYDLCVMVAPTAVALQRVAALVDSPVTVLCAQFGSTTIAWMLNEAAEAHASGALLHGLVLWDGPTPRLITRSEQAASVYRRDSMRPATP